MATKTARKPTAAKAARKSTKNAKSASSAMGTTKTKAKVFKGKKAAASKTRTTAKAKKAIAPKKSAASKATNKTRSKTNHRMDDMMEASSEKNTSMTPQPKMKISRRRPATFREEQSLQSASTSVNPATRR